DDDDFEPQVAAHVAGKEGLKAPHQEVADVPAHDHHAQIGALVAPALKGAGACDRLAQVLAECNASRCWASSASVYGSLRKSAARGQTKPHLAASSPPVSIKHRNRCSQPGVG